MIFNERTNERALYHWRDIRWQEIERNVRRLQERIYRNAQQKNWRKVKNLQKLLTRAMSAKLLAIRRTTLENKGRKTAGIDGQLIKTPAQRMELAQEQLNLQTYRPHPTKRIYIPKASGQQRPLGIPTIKDRMVQTIVKLALEPEWEAQFETNSYGFRPGRTCMDAIEQIWRLLNRKTSSTWILDADISGCFDNIAHIPLLEKLPAFRPIIQRWLKAGVVELNQYTDTDTGTPQGGTLSPLLANIALDGLERLFNGENTKGNYLTPQARKGLNKGLSLVRYADDFVVVAPSREIIETYVLPQLQDFLATRGLTLNLTKTRIVHREEGFNFLGFTIRWFNSSQKLLIFPQKANVHRLLRQTKAILSTHKQVKLETVIKRLNPLLRGWCNYYRYCNAKSTFSYVSYRLWRMIWHWAKRRHPKKPKRWIKQRYFYKQGTKRWIFGTPSCSLFNPQDVHILRHIKVKGKNSPYDPSRREYWAKRYKHIITIQLPSKRRQQILARQEYCCTHCGLSFQPDSDIHYHHRIPRSQGGPDTLDNIQALHSHCHRQL